jgi:hypothetical protein
MCTYRNLVLQQPRVHLGELVRLPTRQCDAMGRKERDLNGSAVVLIVRLKKLGPDQQRDH